MGIVTRKMTKNDLNLVVQIHKRAFDGFFLTFLGDNFLYDLYKNFILNKYSICIVAEEDSHIKGFVVGNIKPNALFKNMLIRQGYLFIIHSVKAFIKNPVFVTKKFIYALKYRGEQPHDFINAALLSSLAVDPKEGAKGIGNALINAFCNKAQESGSEVVYLTTDKLNNDRVNSFYIHNGFVIESEFIKPENRIMNRYIKILNEKVI